MALLDLPAPVHGFITYSAKTNFFTERGKGTGAVSHVKDLQRFMSHSLHLKAVRRNTQLKLSTQNNGLYLQILE